MTDAQTGSGTSWRGGRFGSVARCVLAPNAGPMTLDGTNTWVLCAGSDQPSVVIDPGPDDPGHLDAVAAAAEEMGSGEVAVVLLTHHHHDHSEAAVAFARRMGCGVRALDPAYRLGSEGLGEGDVVAAGDLEIEVVATPGHTADSLSFLVRRERAVLTGDTVLGRGTTVVAHPDGQLGAYLGSLQRLRDLAEAHEVATIWPGHGPVIDRALPAIEGYLAHRADRLDQVRAALAQLTAEGVQLTVEESRSADAGGLARAVVERVYAEVDPVLWGAAELSVRAQLAYLADTP